MRTLTIALLLILCGISCTRRTPKSSPAGGDNLPSSFYSIEPGRDTTITTAQGAWLMIPAGAFGDSAVRIEIKEAYTIADIVRGGMITATHGVPLSSGGMIYIHVAGAETMRLRKPVRVLIPSNGLQEGMQLYKGVKNEKGQIDWVDPKPLMKTTADSQLAIGKALFTSNCASCHGIGKALTGPALAWISDREPDRRWLYDFIHNNNQLLAANDPYSCYLFNRYNKTPMNVFPDLHDPDIDRILNYIMNASEAIDSNSLPNYRKGFDSCVRYTRLTHSLLAKQEELLQRRAQKIADNGSEVVDSRFAGNFPAPPGAPPAGPIVTLRDRASVYYQFEINATGWYNCDRLLEGMEGVAEGELRVHVLGAHRQEANVYLVMPGVKVLMPGNELKDSGDVYVFESMDGRMLLPQGQPGFILCMGEDNGEAFWGKVQWTISVSQELTIEPVTMSKEAINAAIAQLHIEDLSVTARDSKHAVEIRSIDTAKRVADSLLKAVEGLKPQFCDCDCHIGDAEGRDSVMIPTAPSLPAQ